MLAAILAFWALYRWFKKQEILYQTNWKIKLSDLEFQNGQTKKRNRSSKSSRDQTPDRLAVCEVQNDDYFDAIADKNIAHGSERPNNVLIDSGAGGDSNHSISNKNKQSDSESVSDTAYSSMDESPPPEVLLGHSSPEVTLIESPTEVINSVPAMALPKGDYTSTKHKISPPTKSTGRWSKDELCEGRIAFDQFLTTLARYKGSLVSVRRVNKKRVKTNVDLWYEMADIMEIEHANLAAFVGACAKKLTVFAVWEHCERGSLTDVITKRELHQGGSMLQFSIALDISRGLAHLHKSAIGAHGNLKASNVVIDNKWVAKITDFGLHRFKEGEIKINWTDGDDDDAHLTDMDWTPPESIRSILNDETPKQNKKGDVYALGIIYKQIICRNEPYSEVQYLYTPEEIITKLGSDPTEDFRPPIPEEFPENQSAMAAWVRLTQQCWDDTPTMRPTAKEAMKRLGKVCPFKASDIRGQASTVMKRYSLYVSDQLKHRTNQKVDSPDIDSKRIEKVDNEHPGPTADHVKENNTNESYTRDTGSEDNVDENKTDINDKSIVTSNSAIIPHVRVVHQEGPPRLRVIPSASVLVCNIVDFQTLACRYTPAEMLSLLNSVSHHVAGVATQHKMLTVETASGGYMAFSGCTDHAGITAQAAMACRDIVEAAGITMQVRIGVGSGPVAIATVGRLSPRMCVMGGAVMSAVNMEATGLPQQIQMCAKTSNLLSGNPCYRLESRGSEPKTPSFWMAGVSL